MKPLSRKEIDSMRFTVQSIMVERVSIYRPTLVSDGKGGKTQTYVNVLTVPAFFYHRTTRSQGELVVGERIDVDEPWVFEFPYDTDIRHSDRIYVGSRRFEVGTISSAQTNNLLVVVGGSELF